ncbi:hypothetical protein TNCV_2395521 [Trichonephila clavipes]|nr:hypothetical protein TNCV_2395521 [Trichonephila clavipes]
MGMTSELAATSKISTPHQRECRYWIFSSSRIRNLEALAMRSRWCGVVVRRGGASSVVVLVTGPRFKITRPVAKSPRVAEHREVSLRDLSRMWYQHDGATAHDLAQPFTFLVQTLDTLIFGYEGQ